MTLPEKLVGLDVGDRRVGIAVTDGLGLTAQPRGKLQRTSRQKDLRFLADLAEKEEAQAFVIGLPRRTSGEEGPEARKVRAFGDELASLTGLPVHYSDERFSTTIAQSVLIDADVSRRKRRERVDQLAAAVILQGYLDRQRNMKRYDES